MSILIKDTTREQREQIVRDALGDGWDIGCDTASTVVDYYEYIDGKTELKELNARARCGRVVAHPEEPSKGCVEGL